MSDAVRVLLWRHGQTAWNAEGRFQGQLDVDLDATGQIQAAMAADLLAALEPAAIVSSDLARAHQTALALAARTGLQVQLDQDLRETHGGKFQGLLVSEIQERLPREWAAWVSGDSAVPSPGGESREAVAERMVRAVRRAADGLEPGTLGVLATHGGAARLAVAALIGLPLARIRSLGVMSNTAWTMLERRSGSGRSGGITGAFAAADGDEELWVLVEHNAKSIPEAVSVEEG